MKYAIVTVQWCLNKGLVVSDNSRKSLDGSSVIFHYDYIAPILIDYDKVSVYEYDSLELNEILNSKEWCKPIEEELNNTEIN